MNVQGARQRAAVARGFGKAAPTVIKRVVVEVPKSSAAQDAEIGRLLDRVATLTTQRDQAIAELARMQAMHTLIGAAA